MTSSAYKVIGVMSGTSLDGMDLAFCSFLRDNNEWKTRFIHAETIQYDDQWKQKLACADQLAGEDIVALDREYGALLGAEIKDFIKRSGDEPDLIASHGHTVFHKPASGYSLQIGYGPVIAGITGKTVVSDFRAADIALDGQGAPLVPAGDEHLFSGYSHCLNLGGFSNISFRKGSKRMAFDICPCNCILNRMASELGAPFDKDGKMGSRGRIDKQLLNQLDNLDYYKKSGPKSLGREWLDEKFMPLLEKSKISSIDQLATIYEHISGQIAAALAGNPAGRLLVTGGGAHNAWLVRKITEKTGISPEPVTTQLIDYKEAMIFAFLGVLRMEGRINCYASATGASRDSCCGMVSRT